MKRTKIIVTYGSGIAKESVLCDVIRHADIVRLNLSHGDMGYWKESVSRIRKVSARIGKEVALLADLPGPKIRTGKTDADTAVTKGDAVMFSTGRAADGEIHVEFSKFPSLVIAGSRISIGDGNLSLRVESVHGGKVECTALDSGSIGSRKGINVHSDLGGSVSPTEEDLRLAEFAVKEGFDFLGLSFVNNRRGVKKLKRAVGGNAQVIAKIERKSALLCVEDIAREADGVMVARGDLAFDIDITEVPIAQLRIIKACREARIPVIVATQMLVSMVSSRIPTRAEVNDIATAVLSGADAVMLSEETAIGKYPVDAVRTMHSTILNAERFYTEEGSHTKMEVGVGDLEYSIAHAACRLADDFGADCIFAPTQSGATAKRLSALRPSTRVIALSDSAKVRRLLALYYGIEGRNIQKYETVDSMLKNIKDIANDVSARQYIVIYGTPHRLGSTDSLKYISSKLPTHKWCGLSIS
jgi:pyruvate kinase